MYTKLDVYNQDVYKAIDIIENKHKQQTKIESIFEHIIENNGNGNVSKIFLKIKRKTSQTIC